MASQSDQIESSETLLAHYVYVLADPEDRSIFYVGKGQGSRVTHHWADAQREVTLDTVKVARLRALKRRDAAPLELIIGRYETEDEAFAVEATLISWVYGFDNLANAIRGHGHDSIRELGDWEPRAQLDFERRVGVRDGEFRNQKIAGLTAEGAYDYLENLTKALEHAGLHVRDFSDAHDRAYHPGESNGCKSKRLKIELATTIRTRKARSHLIKSGWELGDPRNQEAGPLGERERRYQAIKSLPEDVLKGIDKKDWYFEAGAIVTV
eukprot:gene18829-19145_t